MQLKYLPFASLLALVSADGAQFTKDLQSLAQSLGADPSVRSLFAAETTLSPAQLSQLKSAEAALATETGRGPSYWDAPPSAYSAFPDPYNSYYLSVWSLERSLAIKDGVATGGPDSAAPSVTAPATVPASASASGSGSGSATAAPTTGSSAGASGSAAASVASGSGSGSPSASAPAPGSSTSTGGAAAPTGMLVMGAVAGVVGGIAALL